MSDWICAQPINRDERLKTNKTGRASQAFEKSLASYPPGRYVLRLFVAGATARSRQAVLRVRKVCEAELKGRCELEVIDIYQQPGLARENQIVATPTLVKEFPKPMRRFIGNLVNLGGLFDELDIILKGEIAV